MKFFIDTANLDDIRRLAATGLVDGVTTNPTLAAREGKNFLDLIRDICAVVDGPVSAEVTALETEAMVTEGRHLAALAPNVAVKLPLTLPGLEACKRLSGEGIMVNVTLCFSAGQAILAAKAGATFVSPFVGRLDDLSEDGMALIEDIVTIYENYPAFKTEVLVASIRHPMHVVEAARLGAHVVTVPPKVLTQLAAHPMTDKGLQAFLDDWAKSGQTIL